MRRIRRVALTEDYVVERIPVCGGAAQAVKRGNDDRQGRHQLVGDIGKELQFRVVQLLGFPAFEFRNAVSCCIRSR